MKRWLLGVASLWPPVYLALFVVVVVVASVRGGGEPDDHMLVPVPVLFGLHFATIVLLVVLLVFFLIDAYRNPRLSEDRRRFWAIVLFLGAPIAMPVYWWAYMRPGGDSGPARD